MIAHLVPEGSERPYEGAYNARQTYIKKNKKEKGGKGKVRRKTESGSRSAPKMDTGKSSVLNPEWLQIW